MPLVRTSCGAVSSGTFSQFGTTVGLALTCRVVATYNRGVEPERARELLAAERARIQHELSRLGHRDTGEDADEEDPLNRASDLYQDEFDEGRADDLREELAAVERAEARLAAGTYGLSVETGAPIPDERLEAIPTAERTVEDEAR